MTELDILNAIHSISSPAMDSVMLAATYAATYATLWFVLAAVLMCFERQRKVGVAIIVSVMVAYIVCDLVLKPLVGRERPCDLADFEMLVPVPGTYSFPSGHTMSSFAAATAIFIFHRRAGIVAYVFAAMVGLSRMYLFVHWPTDVVAGAVIGIIVASACVWFMSRYVPYFREVSAEPEK